MAQDVGLHRRSEAVVVPHLPAGGADGDPVPEPPDLREGGLQRDGPLLALRLPWPPPDPDSEPLLGHPVSDELPQVEGVDAGLPEQVARLGLV